MKYLKSDPLKNCTRLEMEWASKNNCRQRSGRAGRVSNGRCYRMVTRKFFEVCCSLLWMIWTCKIGILCFYCVNSLVPLEHITNPWDAVDTVGKCYSEIENIRYGCTTCDSWFGYGQSENGRCGQHCADSERTGRNAIEYRKRRLFGHRWRIDFSGTCYVQPSDWCAKHQIDCNRLLLWCSSRMHHHG